MRPKEVKAAYTAIHELAKIVLPYKTARGVAALKNRLSEELDVVAEMEKALVEKHNGKREKNGAYTFSHEDAEAFAEEYAEAMEQEADIRLPAVDLSPHTDLIRISPGALEALKGIVIFDREEGSHGG